MKKNSKSITIILISFCLFTQNNFAQITGDFRTNSIATFAGNWNASTSWERYNGTTWDASGTGSNNPGQTPISTSSVWIQTAAIITLTQNASCNDLNICNSTTSSTSTTALGRINIQTFTLNVSGKLSCYYGKMDSIPGTYSASGFSYYPFTGTSGKVSIVGNTRNLTNSGEWSATIGTSTNGIFPLEINLNNNQTSTAITNLKCSSLNILSGTFDLSTKTISVDNGTDGQGDITICNGANISCSASGSNNNIFQRTGTKRCGTLTINTGGTLTILGSTPRMDVNAVVLNGTVNYSKSAAQNFLQKNNDALSTNITSYSNIILSGIGTKTLVDSIAITVNGKLSIQGTATLASGNASVITYATNGILEYAGSGSQSIGGSSVEYPNTNGPNNIYIANPNGVSLNTSKTINGLLNLYAGNFSANNNLTINSTGSLIHLGGSVTNYMLPSILFNFTPKAGTTALTGNLTLIGTLALGNNTLDIGSYTLSLNGDFTTVTGKIKSNGSGSISIGGTGSFTNNLLFDQTSPGTTNRLQNFTLNRGTSTSTGSFTLGNTLEVTGTLTLSNGTFNTGGTLTLISNVSGTARVASIMGSADITGNVKVQRYIPAVVRQYRMISPNTASFIFSDIKDNIFVSGIGGSSNGFDNTSNNNSTIYTYHEDTANGRGWKGLTNITHTLASAQGAIVFVRGDRTLTNWYTAPFPAQNAVTLDFNGAINKGTYTSTVTYTNTGDTANDGWNLIGNPYPSQVNWNTLSKANIDTWYYVFDPSSGSYVADNGTNYIASGQAFFIQAIAASPSISFNESDKIAGTPINYFKTSTSSIELKMVKDSFNSDIAWINFNSTSSKGFVRSEDALKFKNSSINFGFYIDSNYTVQRNSVPMLSVADTFILSTYATAGSYTINVTNINMVLPSSKNIYLHDIFNNNLIDLRSSLTYSFTITSNSASSGNRFQLIINDPSMLPVTWLSFSGEKVNSTVVKLNWQTANEKNNDHFEIERSTANGQWLLVGNVKGNGAANMVSSYQFTDKLSNLTSNLYYRLKQVDIDGKLNYSKVITVNLSETENPFVLYPNPASEMVHFNVTSQIQDNMRIDVYNIIGIQCLSNNIFVTKGQEITIDISHLPKGIYTLIITEKFTGKQRISKLTKN